MYTRMLCNALQCRQRATDGATIMRTQLSVFRGFYLDNIYVRVNKHLKLNDGKLFELEMVNVT